ncbi:MAG: RAMP superfamily CRISPR-associated protein, partial [Thermacetogeniaceae bacterium]
RKADASSDSNWLYKAMQSMGVIPELCEKELSRLPQGSFFIDFKFRLRKPYISRDDTEFYVIDNPVKKDWVFKVPYIAPSQWKGCLHAAMVCQLADWWAGLTYKCEETKKKFVEWRLQLMRLFGNEQGVGVDTEEFESYLDRISEEELADMYRRGLKQLAPKGRRRGRLMFYPSFFDGLGVEVINPHSRETGAGKWPIYFETVPEGACGRFLLLYVPFDSVGKDKKVTIREVAEDLFSVARGVVFLLTDFGFGAKTASGFGLAHPELCSEKGKIVVNVPGKKPKEKCFEVLDDKQDNSLVRIARKLADELLGEEVVIDSDS